MVERVHEREVQFCHSGREVSARDSLDDDRRRVANDRDPAPFEQHHELAIG